MRLPLPLDSYQPQSSSRLINCYVEAAPEGGKGPVIINRAPGITLAASPVLGAGRGVYVFNEVLHAVCGTSLISINVGGAVTLLGIIPGVKRVTAQVVQRHTCQAQGFGKPALVFIKLGQAINAFQMQPRTWLGRSQGPRPLQASIG